MPGGSCSELFPEFAKDASCNDSGDQLSCWDRVSRGHGHASDMAMACPRTARRHRRVRSQLQYARTSPRLRQEPVAIHDANHAPPQRGGGIPARAQWSSDHSSASRSPQGAVSTRLGVARARMVLRPFLGVSEASTRGLTLDETHGGSTGAPAASQSRQPTGASREHVRPHTRRN